MDESRADRNGTRLSPNGNTYNIPMNMFYVEDVVSVKSQAQKRFGSAAQCAAQCQPIQPTKTMATMSRRDFLFEEAIPSEWAIWNSPARGSPSRWAESFVRGSGAMDVPEQGSIAKDLFGDEEIAVGAKEDGEPIADSVESFTTNFAMEGCAMGYRKELSLETLFGSTLVASWAKESKGSETKGGDKDGHGPTLSGGSFTMGSYAMDGEEGSSTTDFQFGDAPSAAWTAMQKSRAELRKTKAAAVKGMSDAV